MRMKEILRAAIMDAFWMIPFEQHKKIRSYKTTYGKRETVETVYFFRGCFIAWNGYQLRFVG